MKERVSTLPGVENVAEGFSVPWRGDQGQSISSSICGAGRAPAGRQRRISRGIPHRCRRDSLPRWACRFLQGRDFNGGDKEGNERVVIISQSLANELYPGQNAVNHTLWWTDGVIKFIGISGEPRRIVAVVPDFDDENIIPRPAMTIYQPVDQEWISGRLFVRAHQDPYALVPAITTLIHKMSADQPVERATTLGDVRAEVLTPDKLNAIVFGGFAAVALLISIVGVAGVLAFSVSGRTREFGIRIALGAQPSNILTDVLLDGLLMAGIGVGAGALLGIALTRVAASYISAIDQPGALALGASAFVILAAAMIASAVPAARAARVNAVEALRAE